jgi:phage gpG-like protein
MKLGITIENLTLAQRSIAELRGRVQNPEPAMRSIGEYFKKRVDDRFAEEGPNWKAPTDRYRRWKSKAGYGAKTLTLTGALRASIAAQTTNDSVSIGSDLPYSEHQNRVRPFLDADDRDQREFTDILFDHYTGRG